MKKTAIIALMAAALGAGTVWAHEGMGDPVPGKTATVSGELVDMACYLGHGAKGEKHAKCAQMCVLKGGAPLGILSKDGDLYLVVPDHSNEKPYNSAKEWAGSDAKLTGKIIKSGGLPAIIVSAAAKS